MIQQTSLKAYHGEIKPTLSERHKEVLSAFDREEEFTNLELSKFLNLPINSITPRVNELVKKGIIKYSYTRKCKVSGRSARVWTLTGTPVTHSNNEIVQKFLQDFAPKREEQPTGMMF